MPNSQKGEASGNLTFNLKILGFKNSFHNMSMFLLIKSIVFNCLSLKKFTTPGRCTTLPQSVCVSQLKKLGPWGTAPTRSPPNCLPLPEILQINPKQVPTWGVAGIYF